MTTTAALYLIPVGISDAPAADVIPQGTLDIMGGIQHFIVENVRTARRWLRRCMPHCDIDAMTFRELNRHTDISDVASWLDPLRQGLPMGVMSEAGCPGVADPGALPAAIAQREGLRVIPLTGPSSILMGLMASGFNGQGFTFNGYLPIDDGARNQKMLQTLAATLRPDTLLTVAAAVTDPQHESILTLPAAKWRTHKGIPPKTPAVFIIGN